MHWFGVVQVHRTSSNLIELHHCREYKVCRVLLHEFGVVRLYRTFYNYIFRGEALCVCRMLMHWFGVVQVHRTSSNLLELHHCRESKVCRVLSHEFGLVRLYRTFSNYIFRGEAKCSGCLCTGSSASNLLEPS